MSLIPKKIHYFWDQDSPRPETMLMCMASWKALLPDYEIIQWQEQNLDFKALAEECVFFKKSWEIKLWAYMADYIRFKVLFLHGGIYLDTDVQVLRNMDDLLSLNCFAGFHRGYYRGLPSDEFVEGAVLGSIPGHPFLKDMIDFYQTEMMSREIPFLPLAINRVLQKYGLPAHPPDENIQLRENISIFSTRYFHPFRKGQRKRQEAPGITEAADLVYPETYTIHWNRNSYLGKLKFILFIDRRNTSIIKNLGFVLRYYFRLIIFFLLKLKNFILN